MIRDERYQRNQWFNKELVSSDNNIRKVAEDKVSNYIQLRVHQTVVVRQITDTVTVTENDLDPQLGLLEPSILQFVEPAPLGSTLVPFGAVPFHVFQRPLQVLTVFGEVMSDEMTIPIRRLKYVFDFRTLVEQLMLLSLSDKEDSAYFGTLVALTGTLDATDSLRAEMTGAKAWTEVGSMSRMAIAHARKGLIASSFQCPPGKFVTHAQTLFDFAGSMTREEAGGDLSQQLLTEGITETNWYGVPALGVTKDEVISVGDAWLLSTPKFLGSLYELEAPSLHSRIENNFYTAWAQELIGCSIVNVGAFCRVSFSGAFSTWSAS